MKSVTFKFWVTLEFLRRHCNLKPKHFDFCIEYKPADRTCPFHYQRLELFGLLEEICIKLSVAFLKCFSIQGIINVIIQLSKSSVKQSKNRGRENKTGVFSCFHCLNRGY